MSALDLLAKPGRLTLGLELPLDNDFTGATPGVPNLERHAELAMDADALGFAALWLRDVTVFDAHGFGDAGQIFEPFTYLGHLAACTGRIVLGTAAIALPLRQSLLAAKAAASVQHLSAGRLVLGIASGDRPIEYPLFGLDFETRGDRLRDAVETMRRAWAGSFFPPESGLDLLPRPSAPIPLVMAGRGRQSLEWIARAMDGWFTYPGEPEALMRTGQAWRNALDAATMPPKPLLTAMHLDLLADPGAPPTPLRLGARLGRRALIDRIGALEQAGVSHLSLNLRVSRRPIEEVVEELAEEVMPALLERAAGKEVIAA